METSNYSLLEEEIISNNLHSILKMLKVYGVYSERIGLEMFMQNGRVFASNLNIYKTRPEAIGNINCIVPPLSDHDRSTIKNTLFEILRVLKVKLPPDLFGNVELIADYDPMNKMRIKNIALNLRSSFKLQNA